MSSKTKAENESWQQHVASVILANNGGWEEMHQCNMASREITNQVEAKRGGYVGEVGRKYIWA